MTGLLAAGVAAITAYGVRRAHRRSAAKHQQEFNEIDGADLDEPVVVAEHGIVITDAELVPPDDYPLQNEQAHVWEMPGRGAGPR